MLQEPYRCGCVQVYKDVDVTVRPFFHPGKGVKDPSSLDGQSAKRTAMAQVRKKLGDLRRKSALYAI